MSAPLLEAEGLSLRWPDGPAALHEVSLVVGAGERVGLTGPSGSGKSSFFQLLLGLQRPTAGRLRVLGQDPFVASRRDPRFFHGVHALFQDPSASLNPGLTVTDHLREWARAHDRGQHAWGWALEEAGLGHRRDARPAQLSGGERRRLTLAGLSLARPRLILADEPTAGLDAPRALDWIQLLLARMPAAATLVLCTHDLGLVGAVCDRVIALEYGQKVEDTPLPPTRALAPPVARLLAAARLA